MSDVFTKIRSLFLFCCKTLNHFIKKKELDKEFAKKFGHESEEKQDLLKRKAIRQYQLSSERIRDIAKHMIGHYQTKIYPDKHKAMVVCDGRQHAMKYKQAFDALRAKGYHDFESKVIISLGSAKSDPIAREFYEVLEWNRNHPEDQKPLLFTPTENIRQVTEDFKLPFGNEAEKEKSGKKKYDNTAFLIVSDMLLTGYDAPIASCLYIDKPLKEHNLLQAIARVNRARSGKNAGYIVDYEGISEYLLQAMEIFSGDLRPDDILRNLNEEIPKLQLNHSKLLSFFKSIKTDRNYQRDQYIDEAIRFIEPMHRRDEYKELLKKFNKSINIVLPDTRALAYQSDFILFNEIKVRARNAYPDDENLKVSKEESKMLQGMIDKHLTSLGIKHLLQEPVSIIDKEQFKKDLQNASPATKELKMRNNLKHTIKVGLDKNPDYYKPLAQRLEELIKMREENRITQLELFKAYAELQDTIINENKEGEAKGFSSDREIAVYNALKTLFDEDAENMTRNIFDQIKDELNIVGWQSKGQVQKDIENNITRILKTKMERAEAKQKAKELLEVIKKN